LGYRGSEVAAALGYRNGAGVNKAIQRVTGSKSLISAVKRLEKQAISIDLTPICSSSYHPWKVCLKKRRPREESGAVVEYIGWRGEPRH